MEKFEIQGNRLPRMDNTITYLNTDLVLIGPDDLTELAQALEAGGVPPLYDPQSSDGKWYANFETEEQHSEPDSNISQMLSVIESLAQPLLDVWRHCTLREFNIGYDCGAEPWAFNHGLSTELLQRLGAVGASLRITLYPDRDAGGGATCDISK